MQRRAAAIYAAFFLVVAAGAYGAIGFAQEPTVTVDDPAYSLSAGDTLTADGRTYTVGSVQAGTNEGNDLRSVDLSWVNESAQYTAELEHNSTVPPTDVVWEGQTSRQSATLMNESTVTVDGTEYRLVVAAGESPSEFTLEADGSNRTVALGDTLAYQGEQATVTQVDSRFVRLVWGEPYNLLVEESADPTSFTLTQQFNVSKRLAEDPEVEDETVTRADGERYVVYTDNGSTAPLDEYLPAPERRSFEAGETIRYLGNDTRVASVTNTSVTLAWTAPRTNTRSLSQGGTTTFDGTEHVAHFPDNGTLELSSDVEAYEREVQAVDTYRERVNGFWGISLISGFAAVLLIGAAYLPSRY